MTNDQYSIEHETQPLKLTPTEQLARDLICDIAVLASFISTPEEQVELIRLPSGILVEAIGATSKFEIFMDAVKEMKNIPEFSLAYEQFSYIFEFANTTIREHIEYLRKQTARIKSVQFENEMLSLTQHGIIRVCADIIMMNTIKTSESLQIIENEATSILLIAASTNRRRLFNARMVSQTEAFKLLELMTLAPYLIQSSLPLVILTDGSTLTAKEAREMIQNAENTFLAKIASKMFYPEFTKFFRDLQIDLHIIHTELIKNKSEEIDLRLISLRRAFIQLEQKMKRSWVLEKEKIHNTPLMIQTGVTF